MGRRRCWSAPLEWRRCRLSTSGSFRRRGLRTAAETRLLWGRQEGEERTLLLTSLHKLPVAGLLLGLVTVGACTSVRPIHPTTYLEENAPPVVWVTYHNDTVVSVAEPEVRRDTLRGTLEGARVKIPLADDSERPGEGAGRYQDGLCARYPGGRCCFRRSTSPVDFAVGTEGVTIDCANDAVEEHPEAKSAVHVAPGMASCSLRRRLRQDARPGRLVGLCCGLVGVGALYVGTAHLPDDVPRRSRPSIGMGDLSRHHRRCGRRSRGPTGHVAGNGAGISGEDSSGPRSRA